MRSTIQRSVAVRVEIKLDCDASESFLELLRKIRVSTSKRLFLIHHHTPFMYSFVSLKTGLVASSGGSTTIQNRWVVGNATPPATSTVANHISKSSCGNGNSLH